MTNHDFLLIVGGQCALGLLAYFCFALSARIGRRR